ncbi:hypothetical protein N7517_001559 [Penicillium concentricum]|uniref:Uncharacterized protein n=1 Tax=Penicillium concentricum TaxID=293559 RepID=A0A9W9VIN2_9EURO|nr:uncharacterized protein N7517_001559 [Penicillium concentricum]KAJ5383648.1 hypothetical protein N7517_001559 [Penicillium concentricum]
MIHDKMLSWQLASLMMAHNLKMAVTLGGSIVCCGELPQKLSNQFLKPPCSFASRSVLPPKSPRPSLVYQSFSWQGSGRVWEKHGSCFCPTSEVAGPILRAINRGSPCLNVEIEFQDPHTGSHSVGLF